MTAHDRFRRIEPRRTEEPGQVETADRARIAAVIDGAPASVTPDRIELDERPSTREGAAATPPRAAPSLELPDAVEPARVDLAIDTAPVSGQPFQRCARCGADSGIHAKLCGNCGAVLDSQEQRTFNEKVWETQRRRDERERAALAQMAALRAENTRASVRALPEPRIAPPPELLEPLHDDGGPVLLTALSALQKPKWRWTAGALVVGFPILLVAVGGPVLSKLGWLLGFLCVLAVLPRRCARRVFALWSGGRSRW
ncbi:MAG: hypothetical protein U0441_03170 [Polyangiaceae bacterium]